MKNLCKSICEVLKKYWVIIKKIISILKVARVSIFMVLFSALLFFCIPQTTDAIIALINSRFISSYIIFSIVGLLWAVFVWYWARVFYYLEYYHTTANKLECFLIKNTPRFLGGVSLLIISTAFFIQEKKVRWGGFRFSVIGFLFLIFTVIFLFIVYFRQKIFALNREDLCKAHPDADEYISLKKLPRITRRILYFLTIVSALIFLFFFIFPNYIPFMITTITVILACLCIWIPLLYWVSYASNRLSIPVFLILLIIISFFSMFNQNKDVRFVDADMTGYIENRPSITKYFDNWYEKQKKEYLAAGKEDQRIPVIIVLSEGGGIRAAYWSGSLLAAIQDRIPEFSSHLFAINGVSGGSFGAAVFASLVKYYKSSKGEAGTGDEPLQKKTRKIAGEDYLSPIVASIFTRSLVQWMLPFPVSSLDQAKVFEKKWEQTWQCVINNKNKLNYFSDPFLYLWDGSKNYAIPALFLNITRVENGMPVLVSNLKFPAETSNLNIIEDFYNVNLKFPAETSNLNIIEDFYNYTDKDVRLSSAALLSARFPYVSPAGVLETKDDKRIGLVDGGYFDNTGANTAYKTYMTIKQHLEKKKRWKAENSFLNFRKMIKPAVIYIANGSQTKDLKDFGGSLYSQLAAPVNTLLQTRDAHTQNALSRIREFVKMYDGVFLQYNLDTNRKGKAEIPLGWALSKNTQRQIDLQIKKQIHNVVRDIKKLMPGRRRVF